MTYTILPKNAKIFCCEKCAFNTSNKFNYLKHLDTRKHNHTLMPSCFRQVLNEICSHMDEIVICECGACSTLLH